MDFKKIKQAIKHNRFDCLRIDDDTRLEAVIIKSKTDEVMCQLGSFFGQPVFPAANGLSPQINREIATFGGIMPGQTLYYSRQDNATIFAMLWPWKDGQHVTLKIVKL